MILKFSKGAFTKSSLHMEPNSLTLTLTSYQGSNAELGKFYAS